MSVGNGFVCEPDERAGDIQSDSGEGSKFDQGVELREVAGRLDVE